ncbi:hypothetical protein D3C79_952870 [compost metagenome]
MHPIGTQCNLQPDDEGIKVDVAARHSRLQENCLSNVSMVVHGAYQLAYPTPHLCGFKRKLLASQQRIEKCEEPAAASLML